MIEPKRPRRKVALPALTTVEALHEEMALRETEREQARAEYEEQSRQLKEQNEERKRLLEANLAARKRPQYSGKVDLNDCFLVDHHKLVDLDRRFEENSGAKGRWSLTLVEGRNVSAESLAELLELPVINNRSIERISARFSGEAPGLTEISVTLDYRYGADLDVRTRETARLAAIESDFREIMRSCRLPVSLAYNPWAFGAVVVAIVIFLVSLTVWRVRGSGLTANEKTGLVFLAFSSSAFFPWMGLHELRRRLAPKVQFDIGHSQRDVARRKQTLTRIIWFAGPVMIGSVLLQFWIDYWTA